ncbi:MAG: rhomboid family intramembrane serine protease [Actinomycetota bacterium]
MVIPLHDDNPTTRFAFVTLLLIAVNVFVYFFVQPKGSSEEAEFTLERAAIPCELRQSEPLTVGEYQTGDCDADSFDNREFFPSKNVWLAVLTSMFLHGSILHLAGNMLFLWIFGNNVEDHLGPVLYVIFYGVAGVAAMVAHFLADPGSTVPVIGASGAIAGVMGAYLVLWPKARILTVVPLLLFFVVYLPAGVVLAIWFGMQFLTNPNEGVAWVAHVGGFAAGVLIGLGAKAILGPPHTGPARPEVEERY